MELHREGSAAAACAAGLFINSYKNFGTQIKEEKDRPGTDQIRQGEIELSGNILGIDQE